MCVILSTVPKVRFFVNKYVNLFYHLSVLFSEYFPDEESQGFLNNSAYRKTHAALKTEKLHELFQSLQEHAFYTWDFVGKSLFQVSTAILVEKSLRNTAQMLAEVWLKIYSEALNSYEDIWAQTEPKLKEYAEKFGLEWNCVNEPVLSKLADVARCSWEQKYVNAHLVDCLYGASAWVKDVAVPPFPDFDVEKKLLAHELAHTLVPDYFLKAKLQNLGLDLGVSHTIVDLIAYFGVREHVTNLERRGIKPTPDYYMDVDLLYPLFDDCDGHPEKYQSLDDILKRIVKGH